MCVCVCMYVCIHVCECECDTFTELWSKHWTETTEGGTCLAKFQGSGIWYRISGTTVRQSITVQRRNCLPHGKGGADYTVGGGPHNL